MGGWRCMGLDAIPIWEHLCYFILDKNSSLHRLLIRIKQISMRVSLLGVSRYMWYEKNKNKRTWSRAMALLHCYASASYLSPQYPYHVSPSFPLTPSRPWLDATSTPHLDYSPVVCMACRHTYRRLAVHVNGSYASSMGG